MKRLPLTTILAIATFAAAPVVAQDTATDPAAPPALDTITKPEVTGHLGFIASDLLEGRDTATRGEVLASEYIAAQMIGLGAEPAGERRRGAATYFQRFPLTRTTPLEEETGVALSLNADDSSRTMHLTPLSDFFFSARGIASGEIEAPVVFAGHGIVSEEHGIDDYAELEVKNRWVLVFDGRPASAPKGRFDAASWRAKRTDAEERGAIGLLVVHAHDSEAPPFAESHAWAVRQFGRSSMSLGPAAPSLPMLYLEDNARDFLFGESKEELPADVRAGFHFQAERTIDHGRNVVAMLRGSDPEKAKEVVVYTAHYDHVGVGADGEIFNGADDNGSGTVSLLEIAEAFAEGPRPPRSVAFLWVSGEERGLLGSRWFSDHQTFPEDFEIVANINMDMIGRNDIGKIKVTPSPKHKDYSTLSVACQAAAADEGYEVTWDADQYYRRSDHYNFARLGIPVVFLFSGIHEDYHKATDTIEKVKMEKVVSVSRIAYRIGWDAAHSEDRPRRLSEEERTTSTTQEASF